MNKQVFTLMLLVLCFTSFNSCKKDKETEPATTTVAEDRQHIQLTFDNTMVGLTQVKNGDFFQAMVTFLGMQNGDALNEDWVTTLTDELDNVANLSWIDDQNRFSLSYFGGTYNWNFSTHTWDKTPNTQVVLNFPSDPNATTNNCTLTISDYADSPYVIDNETDYLPTLLKANLTKNGDEIFRINMSSVYNPSGFPIPIDATISLWLKPFNYSFSIKRLTSTQFELRANLFTGSANQTTLYSKLSLAHDDYENLDFETDINTVVFDYQKANMNINGSWDVLAYNNLSNPTTTQLNSTIYITGNYDQKKIGDLRFKDVGSDQELYVFYKDGSSENTSIYYDPFVSDFKALINPYFGDINVKKSAQKAYIKWKIKNLKKKISGWFI